MHVIGGFIVRRELEIRTRELKKGDSLIRLAQQTLQTQQHALHIVYRAPLVLEYIQTDPSTKIHIRVIDGRFEQHCWWCIRVLLRELKGEFEDEVGVGGIAWTCDGGCPDGEIFGGVWEGGDSRGGGHHEREEFLLETLGDALVVHFAGGGVGEFGGFVQGGLAGSGVLGVFEVVVHGLFWPFGR